MSEVESTLRLFRRLAEQRGAKVLVLTEGGGLFLWQDEPAPGCCLGHAAIGSQKAAELVRQAVQVYGMHYLTKQELAP
jgi:hypothetical protein